MSLPLALTLLILLPMVAYIIGAENGRGENYSEGFTDGWAAAEDTYAGAPYDQETASA